MGAAALQGGSVEPNLAQVRPGLAWIMLRRWYLTFVGVLVTAALCAAAIVLVPAKYQASASLLLLPPKTAVGNGGNPYLS
ncbi:MAG: hypothetical protein JWM76_4873, partial [Pseudonocardiales bacterium]|nr:hypothetical protein [Pseudonocardiales bacterium]